MLKLFLPTRFPYANLVVARRVNNEEDFEFFLDDEQWTDATGSIG